MVDASPSPASAALRTWLAAPYDRSKLDSLTSSAGPIDASALTRLPAAAIVALRESKPLHFEKLRPQVLQAILICGLGPRLGQTPGTEEQRELESMPFQVTVAGNDVVVELQPVTHGQRFSSAFLHQWVSGIQADAMVLDCGRINHVNSVMIAWMLQIVQSAKPVPVRVRRAKPQVTTQLKQLRLDHLMVIE